MGLAAGHVVLQQALVHQSLGDFDSAKQASGICLAGAGNLERRAMGYASPDNRQAECDVDGFMHAQ